MIRRFEGLPRFAGAVILALGFLAPGARIPVFQEDPVTEVGRAHAGGKLHVITTTHLVDPRYFSAANIKNRLESYFQMIEQKRMGATGS